MQITDKPDDQKKPGVDKPGLLVMEEPKGDKRRDLIVRCTVPNGIELRVFEMGLEVPTNKDHQLARLKETFQLRCGDRNIVPARFWDQWKEQNPGGFPGIMEIGSQDAPDESPRTTTPRP